MKVCVKNVPFERKLNKKPIIVIMDNSAVYFLLSLTDWFVKIVKVLRNYMTNTLNNYQNS